MCIWNIHGGAYTLALKIINNGKTEHEFDLSNPSVCTTCAFT